MVNKYTVDDTDIYNEDALMRAATLSIPSKKQRTIAKSLDRRFMDLGVFNSIVSSNNVINEVYLDLTPGQIIEFCDEPTKYGDYLNKNSMFLNMGALNVFFINLRLQPTESIKAEHIVFLNNILTKGPNDIYVMPTVHFDGVDRYTQIELYSNFVTKMINYKNSRAPGSLNLGIMIPPYYREKEVKGLYKLYSKENAEPTFVSVDFKGSNIEDKKRMKVVDTITSHYAAEGIEDYFMYGLNLRSFKQGLNNPVSDEMLIVRSGLNAVGAPHRVPTKVHGGSKISQTDQLGVVFGRDDYRFHYLTEPEYMERFLDWSSDRGYRFDIENRLTQDGPKIKDAVKRYNLVTENAEFFDISTAIRKNDKDAIKDMLGKGVDPTPTENGLNPNQSTLDSF